MSFIKSYHVKHRLDFSEKLIKAQKIADYAVSNKHDKKLLTTKYVKHHGLHSDIANQILRKYGRGTIKEATNVNLIVPSAQRTRKYKTKDGQTATKTYKSIEFENGIVNLKPLKIKFRWNPGKTFLKIHQVEIDAEKFMIAVSFPIQTVDQEYNNVLGIDLNCGIGRSIVNAANLRTGEILNIGKNGPNTRKYYYKKRRRHKMKGNREKRIMKDLDHKISRKIVNYALKHKLKIVLEDLKGVRMRCRHGEGSRHVNRFVNSWSFFRLQSYIEYKSKELGIPFLKIHPHYTSQECSYCSIIGSRAGDRFECKNRYCKVYRKERHADINAAFNIGKRSLQIGGRA